MSILFAQLLERKKGGYKVITVTTDLQKNL